MFLAVVGLDWAAGRTDQLFGVEFLVLAAFVHGVRTIFAASEVRLMALIALEICVDGLSVFTGLIVVLRFRFSYLFILFQPLVAQSFDRLFFDSFLQLLEVFQRLS